MRNKWFIVQDPDASENAIDAVKKDQEEGHLKILVVDDSERFWTLLSPCSDWETKTPSAGRFL